MHAPCKWWNKQFPRIIAGVLFLLITGQRAHGQLSQEDLSSEVRDAIDKQTVSYDPPDFQYDRDRGVLGVFLGGRKSDSSHRTPLDYPVDLQFKVELIRKYRGQNIEFWRPYLREIESVVRKELDLITANNGDRQRLDKPLSQMNLAAQSVFQDAMEQSARNTGLKLQRLNGAGGLYKVKFNPPGAKVWYLNAFDLYLAKKKGLGENIDSWKPAVSDPQRLPNGNYYFRGKNSKPEGPINILEDTTINFNILE